jgi:hypothetical protein
MKEKWALLYRKQSGHEEELIIDSIDAARGTPRDTEVGDEFNGDDPEYHYRVVAILSDEASRFLTLISELVGDSTINYTILQEIVDKTRMVLKPD